MLFRIAPACVGSQGMPCQRGADKAFEALFGGISRHVNRALNGHFNDLAGPSAACNCLANCASCRDESLDQFAESKTTMPTCLTRQVFCWCRRYSDRSSQDISYPSRSARSSNSPLSFARPGFLRQRVHGVHPEGELRQWRGRSLIEQQLQGAASALSELAS